MNFENCLFWTVLLILKPFGQGSPNNRLVRIVLGNIKIAHGDPPVFDEPWFGQTAPVNMHNAEISLTSDVKESWFEKLIEFFIGKLVPLISITLHHIALSLDNVLNEKIIYFSDEYQRNLNGNYIHGLNRACFLPTILRPKCIS